MNTIKLQRFTPLLVALILVGVAIPMLGSSSSLPMDGPTKRDKSKRFDYLVRGDMFDGFRGDTAALERAMRLCEDSLRANPRHAEALVWHGSAIWFLSGQAFRAQNIQYGMKLSDSGRAEMDRAVEMDSTNVDVRIPRGASLLATAPYVPAPFGTVLMQTGLTDYEKTLELQQSYFSKLPTHSRGELLGGLADTYRRLGNSEKAREYLRRMTTELPGSEYATRAASWLQLKDLNTKSITLKSVTCIGCHSEP